MSLDIGRVFSDAASSVAGRFGKQIALWAVFMAILIAVSFLFLFGIGGGAQFLTSARMGTNPFAGMEGGIFVVILLYYVIFFLIKDTAFAAQCSISSPLRDPTIGDAMGDGFRSALTLLVVTVIVGIGFVLLIMLLGMITGSSNTGILPLLSFLAALSVLMVKLGMAWPIVAIDGERNPISAMARAWSMTNRNFWLVFVCYLLWFIAIFAIGLALAFGVATPLAVGGGVSGPGTVIFLLFVYFAYYAFFWLSLASITAAIHAQLSNANAQNLSETFQ